MNTPAANDTKSKDKQIRALYIGLALGSALIYCLLIYANGYLSHIRDTHDLDVALLDKVAAHKDDGNVTTMVMLGNSRMRYAMQPEDKGEFIAVQYADDVALFASYAPMWDKIIAAKPDYIVIQDQLLTADMRVQAMSLSGISNIIYSAFEVSLSGKDRETIWRDARNRVDEEACIREYDRAEMQDRMIFAGYRDRHNLENNPNTELARASIKKALGAGIKIVIIRLPSNTAEYDRFDVPSHMIDFYGLGYNPSPTQLLPDLYNRVTWMDYDEKDSAMFCDFVHLNAKGREKFSNWLYDKHL